jgi:hypothetical protein
MNPPADAGPALRDIHLPPVPGWWPPAPGWWLLAFVMLALLVGLGMHLYKRLQRRRHRRAIMAELDRCIARARDDPAALATALSNFLRRLSKQEDAAKAALVGELWLAHLDGAAGSNEFSSGIGRVLIEAPFRPAMQYDAAALIALVRRWTRRALVMGNAHA